MENKFVNIVFGVTGFSVDIVTIFFWVSKRTSTGSLVPVILDYPVLTLGILAYGLSAIGAVYFWPMVYKRANTPGEGLWLFFIINGVHVGLIVLIYHHIIYDGYLAQEFVLVYSIIMVITWIISHSLFKLGQSI